MRSAIFNILFYAATLLAAVTLWILAKISNRRIMWKALHLWSGTVKLLTQVILGAKIEVRGREHLSDKPQLIVGKHQSELDVVMMVDELDDFSAVVMAELANYPMFPTLLNALDLVLVAVDQGKQGRTQQTIAGGKRIAAEGRDMLIYPEGELMKLGAKERYKSGVGHLYCNMEVEAVPVAFSLGVIWPQRQWRKYPNKRGVMEFMEPIPPGLPFDEFMALIEERLENRTMDLIRETAEGDVLEAAERRFANKENNLGPVEPAKIDAPPAA
ncbi:MAG: lysophospholipid acyltransferase family protein [Pseudomonadota bacterium]